jgi:hypothetical protein
MKLCYQRHFHRFQSPRKLHIRRLKRKKEAFKLSMSPVKVVPQPDLGHQEQDLPPSSPYNTIQQELGLYNPSTRSDPTNKFIEVMKKQKMSTLSALAQQAKPYFTTAEIGSYE